MDNNDLNDPQIDGGSEEPESPQRPGDEKRILIYISGAFVVLAFIAYMVTKSTQAFELLDSPFLIIIGYYFGSQSR